MKDCDDILVMKDGMIAEQGSHDQLLAKDGEYANLLRLHSKDQDQNNGATPEQNGNVKSNIISG